MRAARLSGRAWRPGEPCVTSPERPAHRVSDTDDPYSQSRHLRHAGTRTAIPRTRLTRLSNLSWLQRAANGDAFDESWRTAVRPHAIRSSLRASRAGKDAPVRRMLEAGTHNQHDPEPGRPKTACPRGPNDVFRRCSSISYRSFLTHPTRRECPLAAMADRRSLFRSTY